MYKPTNILFSFLFIFSSVSAETLIILERSGTLTFTQELTQKLQQTNFNHTVHIAYIDALYASLTPTEKIKASEIYWKSILLAAGIEQTTPISKIISQGSAPGLFLEHHPDFFANAERLFTHILWEPKTGIKIPSDIDIGESIQQGMTLFPNRNEVLLLGSSLAFSNHIINDALQQSQSHLDIEMRRLDYAKPIIEQVDDVALYDAFAIATHTPETDVALNTIKWLKERNVPIFFVFANEQDLTLYQAVGGLVVSPVKLAELISKLANNESITDSDLHVTVPLYYQGALDEYSIEPEAFYPNYIVVGRPEYSYEQVQIYIQVGMSISIGLLLLYVITGLKARKLLKERAKIAEQANFDKDKLIANISHELRTPLSAIHLAFEALNKASVSESRAIIQAGRRSTVHLKNIVNTILNFQKSSTDNLQVKKEWLKSQSLTQVLELHRIHADDKHLQFEVQGLHELPNYCFTDEQLLVQILHNILSNAVKFTESGGIYTTFSYAKEELFIEIRDTGIGMTQQTLDELYVPFKQADSITGKKHEGTGLGMALSKNLVALLKGDISVYSTIDIGTQFTLRIPVEWKTNSSYNRQPEVSNSILPISILVVEDDSINRELMLFMLKEYVKTIITVPSGSDALLACAQHTFDVVLTDIQMPDMDGLELFEKLRAQNDKLPIIAITGNALSQERNLYLEMGFNHVLAKPFTIQELVSTLGQFAKHSLKEEKLTEHMD
jgi:signal transduction histidine kinase/ActR/RegA family two-component response regulator